ncbi:hypothetical protein F2Q69_00022599 [Brassica cretica]|uniref:Uncharacterized protein n=1 Tax=Brassica cretica TaxID=69181 RepID=A0A8S9QA92_BRACR|nr:hypothetical protein F2Q69_00022599 [Brassica cretica]
MEEAASENNVSDTTTEGDNTVDDQQEVSYVNGQGWQYKNYHPNPNEILTDDPLELALIRSAIEHNVMSVDADGYDKMLDSAKSMERLVALGKDDRIAWSWTLGPPV